ncbi:hypothetical protein G7Y89_g3346 [Cudoniella acicularis]|uniref:PPPDE domain-containing protein n=1 Tax=Cudoniella acicularis TaxID=354080 RepID=A0A8H4RSU5_9HELO|nr:hypothetical protein G7Y89_g3346 [Cudoniella acicularis]
MVHKYPNKNRIPDGLPNTNDVTRPVKIGYRVIGGEKWDGAFNLLRQLIDGKANIGDTKEAPNVLCHWCVIVGDYYHQLQATDLLNWYDNNKVGGSDGWALYTVGETSFNDVSIKNSGEFSIYLMPEHYQLYNNNCQTFTVTLLDQICRAGRVRVTTTYATNQANYLPRMEADAEDGKVEVAVPLNDVDHEEFLDGIRDLMEQKTPPLTDEDIAKAKAASKGV